MTSGDPGYDANVPHGIIATPSDLSLGIQWYNGSWIATGASATALGTGNANTNTIVTIQGAGSYAASLCYNLVFGGYSDWYLPSKYELVKLYLNRSVIGGFASTRYWSSSEHSTIPDGFAWYFDFDSGGTYTRGKDEAYFVRAIRAF